MERKQILIIGMFDSIHLARWLKQFESTSIDFKLFPSKKFKYINIELLKLLESNSEASYKFAKPYYQYKLIGYFDFLICKIGDLFNINVKLLLLNKILSRNMFNFVHAIEIQGAGYLYLELPVNIKSKNLLILTNWGSDIFFFQKDPVHNSKISKIINLASYYSAECERDYELLKNYDFKGNLLPCIPNGGGFDDKEFNSIEYLASDRDLILCKGYGGKFGRVDLSIPAIENTLKKYLNLNVFFYSVTKDVENLIIDLAKKYKDRVEYSVISKPISHTSLMQLFKKARVYIACSESDGISTSFLEAIVNGAYPIQTNTSCVNEWADKGIICSIVGLDVNEITTELEKVIADKDILDNAQKTNLNIARLILSKSTINQIAHKFYDVIPSNL
jgi:hypothetical protein